MLTHSVRNENLLVGHYITVFGSWRAIDRLVREGNATYSYCGAVKSEHVDGGTTRVLSHVPESVEDRDGGLCPSLRQ